MQGSSEKIEYNTTSYIYEKKRIIKKIKKMWIFSYFGVFNIERKIKGGSIMKIRIFLPP